MHRGSHGSHRFLEVVIFAETRTENKEKQEKAVLLTCSLFATNIQHQRQRYDLLFVKITNI